MPAIVSAVIKVGVAILTSIGASTALATSITTFVLRLALTVAINAAMTALTPKPKGMDQSQQLQTKVDVAFDREVIVGWGATGGSVSFENVSGTNNDYFWRIIPISDCEIESCESVLGNGETLTFSGDIHTGLRGCTSHFQDKHGVDLLSIRVYKGSESQTADADLLAAFPSLLDANFRGRGIAYVIARMLFNAEAWPGGLTLSFVCKGAKCFDPRTGLSAWTDNPVLIGGQFLRGFTINGFRTVGMGCEDADLPEADYISAADECDELVALKAGGTEKRYRAGGVISAGEAPREVLAHLVAAMGGKHVDRGGEIVLVPGVWRAPVREFAEADIMADVGLAFAGRHTADERVNAVLSTFVDPDNAYQESQLPPRSDAAAIIEDGSRFETTRAWRFCFSRTQGQRLDAIVLKRGRKEGFLSCTAPLWGFELAPCDTMNATNRRWGNVEKYWEVESLDLAIVSGAAGGASPSARCGFTFRETGPDVFDWDPATEEYDPPTVATLVQPPPLDPVWSDDGSTFIGDLGGSKGDALNDLIVSGGGAGSASNGSNVTAADATWQSVAYVDIAVPSSGQVYFPGVAILFADPASATTAGVRIIETDTSDAGASTTLSRTQVLLVGETTEFAVPGSWGSSYVTPAVTGSTRRFRLQVQRASGSGTVSILTGNGTLGVAVAP